MSFLLAVPSCMPGGLDAQMGMHFGHCDIYTIVEIEDNAIKAVGTLENVPHQQGGCMAPVQHLASHGVKALLAGGMGMRPLMGFQQVGVNVFFAGQYPPWALTCRPSWKASCLPSPWTSPAVAAAITRPWGPLWIS